MSQVMVFSQATAEPMVAGSSRQQSVVLVDILGYKDGYAGPEVDAMVETPHSGMLRMTLPASAIGIYTLWSDEHVVEWN